MWVVYGLVGFKIATLTHTHNPPWVVTPMQFTRHHIPQLVIGLLASVCSLSSVSPCSLYSLPFWFCLFLQLPSVPEPIHYLTYLVICLSSFLAMSILYLLISLPM